MKKKIILSILSVLIIIITLFTIKKSLGLHKEFKNVRIPTKESRHLGEMSTYKWITVKKLSKKYNISEEEIFKILEIVSQPGDENMDIKSLSKKYNISIETMKNNLSKIIGTDKDVKGKDI
ncbi:hypothetical protein [Clostridium uliginosum]|uniref:Uncharacterized protein n=1 Tax=Clostridium uliginosum TaxID=119641 RepID=A0A1I1LT17_9CLOT|nr:hypothetical protein [Clostridium uliginosum]SFC76135.1 hypothetical protein SAMN05421842_10918 [Clostridium uliginosum]